MRKVKIFTLSGLYIMDIIIYGNKFLLFTTNNQIEKNILWLQWQDFQLFKKIPTRSPISMTCQYTNNSFWQLKEFYKLLLQFIWRFWCVCVEAETCMHSVGQVGRSRHCHLPATLKIIENQLCSWFLHFISKYLCYLCPSWLPNRREWPWMVLINKRK
jgi:hypothetical protein